MAVSNDKWSPRNFKRAYVWELPVRVFHWVNFLCIIVLSATGFLIADPPAILSNEDATSQYWFGIIRFTHFAAAYLFTAAIVMRLYWFFVGNQFARWSAYWPWTKAAIKNAKHVVWVDVMLLSKKEHRLEDLSIGHNSLAAFAYLIFFVLFFVMILTGFGLYAPTSEWWLPNLFAWVPSLLGGDFNTRIIHHGAMWLILIISIIHVYLVFYHEWLEGRGEVSSMFSGYKFIRAERFATAYRSPAKKESAEEVEQPVEFDPNDPC